MSWRKSRGRAAPASPTGTFSRYVEETKRVEVCVCVRVCGLLELM